MRVLQVKFLRAFTVRQMFLNEFNHLDVGVANPSSAGLVQANVHDRCFCNHGINLAENREKTMMA